MEKVKIYLDEDVRPLLAEVLRSRGYDAVSCVERGFFGLSDREQLNIAMTPPFPKISKTCRRNKKKV